MSLKEGEIAKALNGLSSSNFSSAAHKQEWLTFVTDFFVDDEIPSEEEDSDVEEEIGERGNEVASYEDEENEQPITDVDEVNRAVVSSEEVCVVNVSGDRDEEISKIRAFRCSCKYHNGASCFLSFDEETVYDLRMSMASLTEYEKDLVLLGKISCHINNNKITSCSKRKQQQERQHQRTEHYVDGRRVCRDTFKFLHW